VGRRVLRTAILSEVDGLIFDLSSLGLLALDSILEMLPVDMGKATGNSTAKERANDKGVDVVAQRIVRVGKVGRLEAAQGHADSRVEAASELA